MASFQLFSCIIVSSFRPRAHAKALGSDFSPPPARISQCIPVYSSHNKNKEILKREKWQLQEVLAGKELGSKSRPGSSLAYGQRSGTLAAFCINISLS